MNPEIPHAPRRIAAGDAVFQTLVAIVIFVLATLFVRATLRYPYYYTRDMDGISTVDVLLINSGSLPDHLNHPSFGMYLLLSASSRAARALNHVSTSTLKDLGHSLNPLAGMAELTEYFRLHTPISILAAILALWLSLRLLFPLPRAAALLALIVLGCQEGLFYQASLIRTEMYSVLYFCLAFLLLALTARAPTLARALLYVFVAGVLLGLSFLTKIQSFLFIAAFPVLLLLALSLSPSAAWTALLPTTRLRALTVMVSFATLLVFAVLLILAYRTSIPLGYGTYTQTYGMTLLAALALAALGVLFLLQMASFLAKKPNRPDVLVLSSLGALLAAGFVTAFLLHLPLYRDLHVGSRYLLYDFKVLFLRPHPYRISFASHFFDVFYLSRYLPWTLCIHLALLALLAVGRAEGLLAISPRQVLLCAGASCFALLHLLFATRYLLRDLVWVEVLFNLLTLVYASIAICYSVRRRVLLQIVAYAAVAFLLGVNLLHVRQITTRTDANLNLYGCERGLWFDTYFHLNQAKYAALMQGKYTPASAAAARRESDRFGANRRLAEFVFKNQGITQRNIGLVSEDFPVTVLDPACRIASYPSFLRNALVIDSAAAPREKGVFFWPKLASERAEFLDKFRQVTDPGLVSILPRKDLRLFLFAEEGDLRRIGVDKPVAELPKITLSKQNETIETYGEELTGYNEVPVTAFSGIYYFVILPTAI